MVDYLYLLAAAYNTGAYGQGDYSVGAATTAANSGGLANTGVAIIGIASAASLLIFAVLIVRFWKRKTAAKHYIRSR